MEQHILKTHLLEVIGNRKVVAAVFHTFNFEPAFFENYVLPMLVPSREKFTNDTIANQILWRECIKNGEMPFTTVYCDDFAKNNAEAPMLNYEVRCIRLPEAKDAICNFHPKHIFILLENDELLIATGSGNLTQAGWCMNLEAFHFESFKKPYWQRPFGQKGELQLLAEALSTLSSKALSEAESLISERSLRYFSPYKESDKSLGLIYYSNFNQSFADFLDTHIFQQEEIKEAEIISPYFSNNASQIDFLKSRGLQRLRFLLPVSNNEVIMEKATFELLSEGGVTWHTWEVEEFHNRWSHAKVYRFYGEQHTYTVVGSVNFTTPAWGKFKDSKNNQSNIEAAVLHIEELRPRLLARKELDVNKMVFLQKNDLENASEWQQTRMKRKKPDIAFTIDWQAKKLKLVLLDKGNPNLCFKHILDKQPLQKQNFDLDRKTLRQLARNCMIEIQEVITNSTYFYYPNHEHFEQKPMPFRLPVTSILFYWNKLDEQTDAAALSRFIADATDEDSGELIEGFSAAPSLLNEWALHFNGLIKLEKHLTADRWRQYEQLEQAKRIEWYLMHTSYETIPFYLDEIRQQHEEGKIYHSFYWMILQIVAQNLYGHKWLFLESAINIKLAEKKKELEKEARVVLDSFYATDSEKWEWLHRQISIKN